MSKTKELTLDEINELALRNPQVDFDGQPNLAVQTGNKSIAQMVEDFDRAGQAIQVARADGPVPELPGLPYAMDPIEVEVRAREIDAEILIARKKLTEHQEKLREAATEKATKNEQELERIKKAAERVQTAAEPKTEP